MLVVAIVVIVIIAIVMWFVFRKKKETTITPPAETGTKIATPPAETGTKIATPPAETGTKIATPPAETGTKTATPPTETGTKIATPPTETGTKIATPPDQPVTQTVSGDVAPGDQFVKTHLFRGNDGKPVEIEYNHNYNGEDDDDDEENHIAVADKTKYNISTTTSNQMSEEALRLRDDQLDATKYSVKIDPLHQEMVDYQKKKIQYPPFWSEKKQKSSAPTLSISQLRQEIAEFYDNDGGASSNNESASSNSRKRRRGLKRNSDEPSSTDENTEADGDDTDDDDVDGSSSTKQPRPSGRTSVLPDISDESDYDEAIRNPYFVPRIDGLSRPRRQLDNLDSSTNASRNARKPHTLLYFNAGRPVPVQTVSGTVATATEPTTNGNNDISVGGDVNKFAKNVYIYGNDNASSSSSPHHHFDQHELLYLTSNSEFTTVINHGLDLGALLTTSSVVASRMVTTLNAAANNSGSSSGPTADSVGSVESLSQGNSNLIRTIANVENPIVHNSFNNSRLHLVNNRSEVLEPVLYGAISNVEFEQTQPTTVYETNDGCGVMAVQSMRRLVDNVDFIYVTISISDNAMLPETYQSNLKPYATLQQLLVTINHYYHDKPFILVGNFNGQDHSTLVERTLRAPINSCNFLTTPTYHTKSLLCSPDGVYVSSVLYQSIKFSVQQYPFGQSNGGHLVVVQLYRESDERGVINVTNERMRSQIAESVDASARYGMTHWYNQRGASLTVSHDKNSMVPLIPRNTITSPGFSFQHDWPIVMRRFWLTASAMASQLMGASPKASTVTTTATTTVVATNETTATVVETPKTTTTAPTTAKQSPTEGTGNSESTVAAGATPEPNTGREAALPITALQNQSNEKITLIYQNCNSAGNFSTSPEHQQQQPPPQPMSRSSTPNNYTNVDDMPTLTYVERSRSPKFGRVPSGRLVGTGRSLGGGSSSGGGGSSINRRSPVPTTMNSAAVAAAANAMAAPSPVTTTTTTTTVMPLTPRSPSPLAQHRNAVAAANALAASTLPPADQFTYQPSGGGRGKDNKKK